jgi:integrase
VGIKDPEKSFHSLRHTVIDGLKQKGVGESYISEYVGHSSGDSETFGRYGKQYRANILMEEVVQKIEYGILNGQS